MRGEVFGTFELIIGWELDEGHKSLQFGVTQEINVRDIQHLHYTSLTLYPLSLSDHITQRTPEYSFQLLRYLLSFQVELVYKIYIPILFTFVSYNTIYHGRNPWFCSSLDSQIEQVTLVRRLMHSTWCLVADRIEINPYYRRTYLQLFVADVIKLFWSLVAPLPFRYRYIPALLFLSLTLYISIRMIFTISPVSQLHDIYSSFRCSPYLFANNFNQSAHLLIF